MTVRTNILGLSLATAMLVASAAPAQAFTPELVEAKLHFWECLGLVFTDPATHLTVCGVGEIGTPQSLNFYITGVIVTSCMSGYYWYMGSCQPI